MHKSWKLRTGLEYERIRSESFSAKDKTSLSVFAEAKSVTEAYPFRQMPNIVVPSSPIESSDPLQAHGTVLNKEQRGAFYRRCYLCRRRRRRRRCCDASQIITNKYQPVEIFCLNCRIVILIGGISNLFQF